MLIKKLFLLSGVLSGLMTAPLAAGAADYKASLAQMPIYAESLDKGVLVDLVKALTDVSKKTVDVQVVPFARSMKDVENKQVDFHMPLIKPIDMSKANFSLSSETIFHVNFVLYTNKNKPVDVNQLAGASLETDAAHTPYFPFDIKPSTSIENSLKKLELGRIDGFIFADDATDPLVKSLGLKNVKRQLYKRFEVKVILPKGAENGPVDKFLTDAIGKLRESGRFTNIMSAIDHPYVE